MIKNKKFLIIFSIAAVIIAAFVFTRMKPKSSGEVMREVKPFIGAIQTTISSTATVQPQNRLEVKPPINGRIDSIMVREGEKVKVGQTLAWMSSTERAALLDAARARGAEELKYWEDVYKPTPLISPIDGEVIVSTDEPGQTVTSSDAVVVLSDRLIVQAQVDETDVGAVRVGQEASISLDAYPKIKIKGFVDHIYYESTTVNNVTIYKVDVVPDSIPEVFRSGMSATVTINERAKEDSLLLPIDAVRRGSGGATVLLGGVGKKQEERKVEIGLSDEKNVEILSGITENDTVIVKSQKYTPEVYKEGASNPFMPQRPKMSKSNSASKPK